MKDAWETVCSHNHSFKKTGFSNEMDGNEDDALWHANSDKEDNELEFPDLWLHCVSLSVYKN